MTRRNALQGFIDHAMRSPLFAFWLLLADPPKY